MAYNFVRLLRFLCLRFRWHIYCGRIVCLSVCLSDVSLYKHIARNNCRGGHTVQFSHCVQCCTVCPVLYCTLTVTELTVKTTELLDLQRKGKARALIGRKAKANRDCWSNHGQFPCPSYSRWLSPSRLVHIFDTKMHVWGLTIGCLCLCLDCL